MTRPLWTADGPGIASAAAAVGAGEVIGFPTDTVYGLACSATSEQAITRLCEVKGRPTSQPLILMAPNSEELQPFAEWPALAADLARKFWPGPLTLIVAARSGAALLGGRGTVGVRIPAHPIALALLRLTGPLATTSANRHGQEPLPNARSALKHLPGLQGALSDDGSSPKAAVPSSILDLTREGPVLIREGGLSARQLGVSVIRQDPRIRRD